MARRLQQHPLFPYIAWGLVLGFSFFTIHLTYTAYQEIKRLETGHATIPAPVTP